MDKENHFEYTLLAAKLYEKTREVVFSPENVPLLLAQGSYDEDKYNLFTLDLQRLANWHFYNNKGRIGNSKLVPGVRTSEKRVEKLIQKVLKARKRYVDSSDHGEKADYLENLLSQTGRLIHHIQDMSTFSHVVPVYHGPGLKDSYEIFGAKMLGKIKIVTDGEPEDGQLCITIGRDEVLGSAEILDEKMEEQLFNLYRDSAEETLRILKDNKYGFSLLVNKEDERFTWNYFWKEETDTSVGGCPLMKNNHRNFGEFGELCNNFGIESFDVGDNSYAVDEAEYLKIYKVLMEKSIKNTVQVLALVVADLDINVSKNSGIPT